MKYLVMDCHTSYAVLLDEQGRFVKSANLGYEVGDTVENPVLMLDEPLEKVQGRSKMTSRIVTAVVAIAAVVAIVFGINVYQENYAPYSSIFMAINPEVEMVLNKQGEVLRVEGTNADGTALVDGYEVSDKNKTVVTNDLVDRAIEMGFLADGGQVSIAIDTPDNELFEKYGLEIRTALDGRTSVTIQITDLENRNRPLNNSAPKDPVEDDSNYDESVYEDDSDDVTPAPAPALKPAPTPVVPDDSGYDDTGYDDSDYDDDDSDYEDSNDDDSDYDTDSDYDDDDDSDYD